MIILRAIVVTFSLFSSTRQHSASSKTSDLSSIGSQDLFQNNLTPQDLKPGQNLKSIDSSITLTTDAQKDLTSIVSPSLVRSNFDTPVPVYDTCVKENTYALTFDDGPSADSATLDGTLSTFGAKASYFVNGNNFGCIYDYAPLLISRFNAGHLLGSHTWSHVHLAQGTHDQIHQQLELIEKAMIAILGVKPLWFRPPYGEYNDLVLQVLAERGYKGLVMWTADCQDTSPVPLSSEAAVECYTALPSKSNILTHETKEVTVQVMPLVIPKLKEKGYSLVTIPECLNLSSNMSDWYQYIKAPSPKDESWTCVGTPGPGTF